MRKVFLRLRDRQVARFGIHDLRRLRQMEGAPARTDRLAIAEQNRKTETGGQGAVGSNEDPLVGRLRQHDPARPASRFDPQPLERR
jgi:hypothetical protein